MYIVNPLVSVVVPLYNSYSTIIETLDSIKSQTYLNVEVIIVNDGSTDISERIVNEYIVEHQLENNWHLISQANRGLAGARNTGIRCSSGELVAFCDADDAWHPDKLRLQVEHFTNTPNLGLSYSRSEFMDEQSNHLGTYQNPKLTNISSVDILKSSPPCNGSTPVLARALLDDVEYYDLSRDYHCWFDEDFSRSEDVELWLRISLITSWIIEGIEPVLTYYRINSNGLSADILKQMASKKQVFEKTASYAPEFIDNNLNMAYAYQYRFLSRRGIRNKHAGNAIFFINKSLLTYKNILFEEPKRTILTFIAAYLLLLPKNVYSFIEENFFKVDKGDK